MGTGPRAHVSCQRSLRAWAPLWVSLCVCTEARGRLPGLFYETGSLSGTRGLPIRLDWLVRDNLVSTCFCLSSTKIANVYHNDPESKDQTQVLTVGTLPTTPESF